MSTVTFIDPDEDRRWDDFVVSHPHGLICHLSGWKRIIEQSFRHIRGYFPVILDGTMGRIRAGMPIYLVNSRITGKRLVSIPFATLSDPLVSSREEMLVLTEAVIQLAARHHAGKIEIRSLDSTQLVEDPRYERIDFFKHHYLLLNQPAEHLTKRFHSTCVRRKIKLCSQNGLELIADCTYKDLECFFEAYLITRKRLGLPPQPFVLFKHLWQEFAPSGKFRFLAANYRGRTAASMILLKFKDRVSWEFIGVHPEYKHLNPTHFLLWEAISLALKEGYKIFDFGRTSPNNQGLMDFKRRWGTVVGELPQFWYPGSGNGLGLLAGMEKSLKYRSIGYLVRKSPRTLLPYLGELCYRHMG